VFPPSGAPDRRGTPPWPCALFGALILLLSGPAQALPVQWDAGSGGNDHFYEVVLLPSEITWQAARTDAQARGGDLASITSTAENAFVFGLADDPSFWTLAGPHNYGPWIGGFQSVFTSEPAGGWEWADGEAWSFTAWASGQPDNNGGAEHHALYFVPANARSATWNDWTGGGLLVKSYVFESTVPEPSLGALLGLGLAVGAWKRNRGAARP